MAAGAAHSRKSIERKEEGYRRAGMILHTHTHTTGLTNLWRHLISCCFSSTSIIVNYSM